MPLVIRAASRLRTEVLPVYALARIERLGNGIRACRGAPAIDAENEGDARLVSLEIIREFHNVAAGIGIIIPVIHFPIGIVVKGVEPLGVDVGPVVDSARDSHFLQFGNGHPADKIAFVPGSDGDPHIIDIAVVRIHRPSVILDIPVGILDIVVFVVEPAVAAGGNGQNRQSCQ